MTNKEKVKEVYPDATSSCREEHGKSVHYIWHENYLPPIGVSYISEDKAWQDAVNTLKTDL